MPIYEYECKKCGRILEILHGRDDSPRVCGADCVAEDASGDGEIERVVSSPAAHTKMHGMATGKIDYDDAARKGFTTFKRAGKGEYERIAGTAGPERITSKD